MKEYSACEIIVEFLIKQKIPYAAGVPGHGILAFLDAFHGREDKIKLITVKHEQSAVHLADAYFRACGKPLVVFTSVGPGAINTLVGLGTAFCDSIPVVVFTASCPTHMFERGAIQELERNQWADLPNMSKPVTKRTWQITNIKQLPDVLQRAFRVAVSGRPGPVHIDLPMDIQAASLETEIPEPARYSVSSRISGDIVDTERAVQLILSAKRPAFLAGGGVILSDASEELINIAEYLGIPVVTTIMGKGAIPEDHALAVYYGGSKGSTCGNAIEQTADVIIAVGCRFAEWTSSSFKHGETFNIPPTKLIHIDIDPREIGKNYPIEVGIQGDAKTILSIMYEKIRKQVSMKDYQSTPYFMEIQKLKQKWEETKESQITDSLPMTTTKFLKELREFLDRDSIVVGAAGHAQAQLFQEFPVYEPRTHISTGAFSTMGFCVPGTIGAKLAFPHKKVVGVMGDGDFLMTCQELATAVQYNIPVVYCLLNNYGWLSIRDLQIHHYGIDRQIATEFIQEETRNPYNPDFVKMAESFGAYAERINNPEDIQEALKRAFDSGKPAVLEIITATKFPESEGALAGWAEFPVPKYLAMTDNEATR